MTIGAQSAKIPAPKTCSSAFRKAKAHELHLIGVGEQRHRRGSPSMYYIYEDLVPTIRFFQPIQDSVLCTKFQTCIPFDSFQVRFKSISSSPFWLTLHTCEFILNRWCSRIHEESLDPPKGHKSSIATVLHLSPPSPTKKAMCSHSDPSATTFSPVNFALPSSAASSIIKPAGIDPGKTKCIDCGDFECCCIPIPCTIM